MKPSSIAMLCHVHSSNLKIPQNTNNTLYMKHFIFTIVNYIVLYYIMQYTVIIYIAYATFNRLKNRAAWWVFLCFSIVMLP